MVLEEILDGMQLPIVSQFDCAHTHPMMTLPIGAELEIDFESHLLSLEASVV